MKKSYSKYIKFSEGKINQNENEVLIYSKTVKKMGGCLGQGVEVGERENRWSTETFRVVKLFCTHDHDDMSLTFVKTHRIGNTRMNSNVNWTVGNNDVSVQDH